MPRRSQYFGGASSTFLRCQVRTVGTSSLTMAETTLVMHEGTELQDAFAKVRILPIPWSAMNPECMCDWQLAKDSIPLDDTKWMRM